MLLRRKPRKTGRQLQRVWLRLFSGGGFNGSEGPDASLGKQATLDWLRHVQGLSTSPAVAATVVHVPFLLHAHELSSVPAFPAILVSGHPLGGSERFPVAPSCDVRAAAPPTVQAPALDAQHATAPINARLGAPQSHIACAVFLPAASQIQGHPHLHPSAYAPPHEPQPTGGATVFLAKAGSLPALPPDARAFLSRGTRTQNTSAALLSHSHPAILAVGFDSQGCKVS